MSTLRLRTALGYAGNQPSTLNGTRASTTRHLGGGSLVSLDGKPGVVNSVTLGNQALKRRAA